MSRASSDDQLKFLLSCVRHSNCGKIDFVEVAKECCVVSRGAAAKRYERLLRANGIHPNGSPTTKPELKPKKRSAKAISEAAEAKRRKIEGYNNDPAADDDDVKPIVPKTEPSADATVKQEQPADFHPPALPLSYTSPPPLYFPGYISPPITLPVPNYAVSSHTAVTNAPESPFQPVWRPPLQNLADSAPSIPTHSSPNTRSADTSELSTAAPLETPAAESVMPRTPQSSDPPSTSKGQIIQNELSAENGQLEAVLKDFCNSDLFMPPLTQQKISHPSSPPAELKVVGPQSLKVPMNGIKAFPSTSCQVYSTPIQQECVIIID